MVVFNTELEKFELLLPVEVVDALNLYKPGTLEPARPVHLEKMRLEWLQLELQKAYQHRKQEKIKGPIRNKIGKVICIGGMILTFTITQVCIFFQMNRLLVSLSAICIFLYFLFGLFRYTIGVPLVSWRLPLIGWTAVDQNSMFDALQSAGWQLKIAEEFS
ncbi:hypothetical protein DCC81_03905 [Chitinophaga parva]|uniref:Uncharacterized protein n=1 Tax=Chitinophaga parva TaxID=2169414 RepID=A0A2T7BLT2_9BACT|nr:hypothetical protein [Chitinophaga parva]PUZ28638.1 hypothetical protein DCC81_03905 [Chitinophaga parva]